MPGCNIYVWLFLFAAFVIDLLAVTVQTGLHSRVELTGEKLDQQTVDSLKEVEWTNLNKSCLCLKFDKQNSSEILYSKCCGKAHFYLNNNSLILENVTAQVEGVFKETIVTNNSATKSLIFVLNILYPLNATGIVVSWSCNNTSVSLTCKVSWTYTDIMWKREDSPIQRDNRHSLSENNQTLHISNITSSDDGEYSCVATNSYGKSETQSNINSEECSTHGENTTFYQEHDANSNQHQAIQIFLWSGLALGILGLCIIVFYGFNKYHHSQVHRGIQDGNTRGHRREDDRTTEEDVDIGLGIYQEVPGTEVSPLPYVYTDFIKPREANQNSAAAEDTKDFGYSEIGPAAVLGKVPFKRVVDIDLGYDQEVPGTAHVISSDEHSTPCLNAEED